MFNLNFNVMKRLNVIFAASLMMMAAISFTSCQKDDGDTTDPLVTTMQEGDEVDSYFDETMSEVDELTYESDSKSQMDMAVINSMGQGTRTRKTSWEGDIRIDTVTYNNFVNGNARFERVKNGQIIIRTTGHYLGETFIREVSFNNFTINGNLIEGNKRIQKTSQYTYEIQLENGKVTFSDGTTHTRTMTRTRTMVEGYDTPYYIWDDVYTIEGSSTGVNRQGNAYTHQITNALVVRMDCRWIVSGTFNVTVNNNSMSLDYGNGVCDNLATATINGRAYEVRLRK